MRFAIGPAKGAMFWEAVRARMRMVLLGVSVCGGCVQHRRCLGGRVRVADREAFPAGASELRGGVALRMATPGLGSWPLAPTVRRRTPPTWRSAASHLCPRPPGGLTVEARRLIARPPARQSVAQYERQFWWDALPTVMLQVAVRRAGVHRSRAARRVRGRRGSPAVSGAFAGRSLAGCARRPLATRPGGARRPPWVSAAGAVPPEPWAWLGAAPGPRRPRARHRPLGDLGHRFRAAQ